MGLASDPGHRAIVLVAFAGTGGTPAKRSAGKATKLPPPATELMAPPIAAAPKSRIDVAACTRSLRAGEEEQLVVREGREPRRAIEQALAGLEDRRHERPRQVAHAEDEA